MEGPEHSVTRKTVHKVMGLSGHFTPLLITKNVPRKASQPQYVCYENLYECAVNSYLSARM